VSVLDAGHLVETASIEKIVRSPQSAAAKRLFSRPSMAFVEI